MKTDLEIELEDSKQTTAIYKVAFELACGQLILEVPEYSDVARKIIEDTIMEEAIRRQQYLTTKRGLEDLMEMLNNELNK